jgi:hypothetical protein
MFLPNDLSSSEQELVATVTRQMLEHRRPSTPEEEQAVRHEAAQVAAEMIQESRASHRADDPEDTDLEEATAESGYHQRLLALRKANLAAQEMEDAEADEPRSPG